MLLSPIAIARQTKPLTPHRFLVLFLRSIPTADDSFKANWPLTANRVVTLYFEWGEIGILRGFRAKDSVGKFYLPVVFWAQEVPETARFGVAFFAGPAN